MTSSSFLSHEFDSINWTDECSWWHDELIFWCINESIREKRNPLRWNRSLQWIEFLIARIKLWFVLYSDKWFPSRLSNVERKRRQVMFTRTMNEEKSFQSRCLTLKFWLIEVRLRTRTDRAKKRREEKTNHSSKEIYWFQIEWPSKELNTSVFASSIDESVSLIVTLPISSHVSLLSSGLMMEMNTPNLLH